jgi:hypothetical protein
MGQFFDVDIIGSCGVVQQQYDKGVSYYFDFAHLLKQNGLALILFMTGGG